MFKESLKVVQFTVLLGLLNSCGGMITKNQIKMGTVKVRGGVHKTLEWDDTLKFQRMSFYQGLTLLYDALMAPIDSRSPFRYWFSESEREYMNSCRQFYLVMIYNYDLDTKKFKRYIFRNKLIDQGMKEFVISRFASNLMLHPDLSYYNANKYKLLGYCDPSGRKTISVSLPGYKTESFSF